MDPDQLLPVGADPASVAHQAHGLEEVAPIDDVRVFLLVYEVLMVRDSVRNQVPAHSAGDFGHAAGVADERSAQRASADVRSTSGMCQIETFV
jgi:hypothetical protein